MIRNYKFLNFVISEIFRKEPKTKYIKTTIAVKTDDFDGIDYMKVEVTEKGKVVATFEVDGKNKSVHQKISKTFEFPFTEDYVKSVNDFLKKYFPS